RGQIDKTLFIKRVKSDILLVQVYVDDIIFGSTKKELCTKFEKLIHKKFQISSMGELTFFLGLQVTQKDDGIFISKDKYVDEILKKFGFSTMKTASTPMETLKPLLKDENAEDVGVHLYRSMIGSLMYLTSSRPNIKFDVCTCARFQVTPKVSHLYAVKRIFTYLKGQPKLGLWYPKDSPFDLEAYTDSDYAGASLDNKSTTGCCQFLGSRLISWQCKKQTIVANSTTEVEYVAAASCCGQIQALVDKKKVIITEKSVRSDLMLEDAEGTECLPNDVIFEQLTLMGDASKQGRKIADLDVDAKVTLIDETQERNDEDLMFYIDVLNGDEVFEEPIVNVAKTTSLILVSAVDPVTTAGEVVTTASATTIVDELTLAQTLIEIKAAKPKVVTTNATTVTTAVANTRPKAKGIFFHDQEEQEPEFTPIV
ncbi:putative ribonuclease H-like domain-containing protein, partial [Tanacetum coccineum]